MLVDSCTNIGISHADKCVLHPTRVIWVVWHFTSMKICRPKRTFHLRIHPGVLQDRHHQLTVASDRLCPFRMWTTPNRLLGRWVRPDTLLPNHGQWGLSVRTLWKERKECRAEGARQPRLFYSTRLSLQSAWTAATGCITYAMSAITRYRRLKGWSTGIFTILYIEYWSKAFNCN